MYEQEFGLDELDGAIQAGVGAVLAATVAAVIGTILSLNFDGAADSFALGAWVVWAGVVAGWLTLVLLDYWVPEKAVLGLALMGLMKLGAAMVTVSLAALVFYRVGLGEVGWWLVPVIGVLMLCGWWCWSRWSRSDPELERLLAEEAEIERRLEH